MAIPVVNGLRLTPGGRLVCDALPVRQHTGFGRGSGHGLLALALDAVTAPAAPDIAFWRAFAGRFMAAVCGHSAAGDAVAHNVPAVAPPQHTELAMLADTAPPMHGGEYLSADILQALWSETHAALAVEVAESKKPFAEFLKTRSSAWSLVGRVHFNLAENRKDPDAPFAFLATYTAQLSAAAKPQHLPLGRALQDYSGARDKARLLSLLVPVQKAAETCPWLKEMVDAGDIYHPLRWTPRDARRFLQDAPTLEQAGVIVRMPAAWGTGRPSRPTVKATIGGKKPSVLGLDAMLDFDFAVSLDGETLTVEEVERLLAETDGLALVRGKWVEIDRDRLATTLEKFRAIEKRARAEGLPFAEAMRLAAGAGIGEPDADATQRASWSETVAGPWLAETLAALRDPSTGAVADPGAALRASLRPYQKDGVAWLHLLSKLGLGACLADDMGLGKTIQVLSLLLVLKAEQTSVGAGVLTEAKAPTVTHRRTKSDNGSAGKTPVPGQGKLNLLVVPASLVGNWMAEAQRFAPSLAVQVVHPSAMSALEIKALTPGAFSGADLVVTTYGALGRVPALLESKWRLAILDEAQAIKNPGTKQAKAVKAISADARIAMTGTPIENSLGDLWALFDFLNPGLLGSAKEFSSFTKRLSESGEAGAADGARAKSADWGPLRSLVRPYILRRMKTDKRIIADLPDKTEVKTFSALTKRQAALYQDTVADLAEKLKEADGMQRKGLVLATLMRLKQLCNHPSQWLGDGAWAEAESGKFLRLREIAGEIAGRQEKVLVFTQFREITAPLATFLGGVFGRDGLVLTGETAVGKRKDLVQQFQEDEGPPFFVLSVKAGGAGLTLTAASHVIHFDRWWNPAVENQATDRAFRIGQQRNVLVHKFVCRGTVEEKIDRMIEEKSALAGDFLAAGAEARLTEMADDELLSMVSLDLSRAMSE